MSTKISDLQALVPPLASDDLLAIVDTGAAVTKSVRADQSLLYVKTSLSTGQILELNSTPIQLVAAPGVGKVIVPLMIGLSFTWNSIAYTINVTLQLQYETGTGLNFDSAILLKTADFINTRVINVIPIEGILQNKKLSIALSTGNPGAGNSALDTYLWYQILTL